MFEPIAWLFVTGLRSVAWSGLDARRCEQDDAVVGRSWKISGATAARDK